MRGKLVLLLPILVALAAAVVPTGAATSSKQQVRIWTNVPYRAKPGVRQVKILKVYYRAHDGKRRKAFVALPAWYGKREHPRIPLVISPHGRGVGARANAALWGALPARGMFAVISPEGAGRKLSRYSWGSVGQIGDLARMPEIARRTLPWLKIDSRRIYAFGGSMGGQETLLLLARYPRLLAGAAAFDAVADFARQYRSFPLLPCDKACRNTWHGPVGESLQSLAREEIGGTPRSRPAAYDVRSPVTYARTIAASCVPLQLWWSHSDRIVNQRQQSRALFDKIKRLNPKAPVQAYVGYWTHSREMQAKTRLPLALAAFGLLLEDHPRKLLHGLRVLPEPENAPRCGVSRPTKAQSPAKTKLRSGSKRRPAPKVSR